jgi:hypothetical protein
MIAQAPPTEIIITFAATGAALKGEEVLQKHGLPVRVMARPNDLGAQCGFCLRVDPENWPQAVFLLEKEDIKIEGLYNQLPTENGRWAYWPVNLK